ncbi:zinc finger, C3HC4 type, partial [Ancylostoma duodenale]
MRWQLSANERVVLILVYIKRSLHISTNSGRCGCSRPSPIERRETPSRQTPRIVSSSTPASLRAAQGRRAEVSSSTPLLSNNPPLEVLCNQLQEHLTCSICLNIFNKPISIHPCGHNFCFMCIQRWRCGSPLQQCPQ